MNKRKKVTEIWSEDKNEEVTDENEKREDTERGSRVKG